MLFILRFIIVIFYSILICVFGSIWCLLSPRNPRHVSTFSHLFGRLSTLFGIKVELRKPIDADNYSNVIYISNHQNNFDMITVANMIPPHTVTIGKKSLIWIPLFGQLYWLTGNILIDRNNCKKVHQRIQEIVRSFNNKKLISFWMFPEGTRSHSTEILPFKTGAFHIAMTVKAPIIPVVVSNTHNKIKLNRWKNGLVIIEMLHPIDTSNTELNSANKLANYCHSLMSAKLEKLNVEVIEREKNDLI
ncbi:1-acylglycerol-3-phosphate O-acyltransferase [Pantoea sp. Mhis]|uniref:1-acylglycerol-3-phosphate O-acyltransferase n=1 Tax=Pantoea sp. Mhis TaxID=2576759 RepID=UPI00135B96E9|nr:1-acylglycerol-3-phosphate O-acyltransferase [Pantoea sp. Mhis]MXP56700.1 1-acylglycerol-3-phosphate O-acyltransferase [Pantoea sp. Mhis]